MRIVLAIVATLTLTMAETVMIKDPITNLIWEDTLHATEDKLTHEEAIGYCKTLTLGDFTGWRVPTLNELLTIVDYTHADPATLKEFAHVKSSTLYWSTTPYARESNAFWGVDYKDGATDKASANYSRYVRCVRGAN